MTLDQRLRAAADDVNRTIHIDNPPAIRARSRMRTAVRPLLPAAVVVAVLAFLPQLFEPPFEVAPGEVLVSMDPPIVRGAPSPEPIFDTRVLGREATLRRIDDAEAAVVRMSRETLDGTEWFKIVLIGASDRGTMAVVAQGSSTTCLWVGTDSLGSCREIVGKESPWLNSRTYGGSFTWGELPPDTSVVTLEHGGTQLWQRPTGGYVLFDTKIQDGDELILTALDRTGNVILSQEHVFRR